VGGREKKTNFVTPIPFFMGLRKVYMESRFCVDFVGMIECEKGWGKLGSFFLFVIGSLMMLRTCRRSSELENTWRKRETAV
jgi:hypothetical protein